MTPARQFLMQYVLEASADEPIARRKMLYRALAAELPEGASEFKALTSLADALEVVEASHGQLLLNIKAQGGER